MDLVPKNCPTVGVQYHGRYRKFYGSSSENPGFCWCRNNSSTVYPRYGSHLVEERAGLKVPWRVDHGLSVVVDDKRKGEVNEEIDQSTCRVGKKVVPSLARDGTAGLTGTGLGHRRSDIQERSLSIGRAIVPGCVDDGARIWPRILLPAFATRVGGFKAFQARFDGLEPNICNIRLGGVQNSYRQLIGKVDIALNVERSIFVSFDPTRRQPQRAHEVHVVKRRCSDAMHKS